MLLHLPNYPTAHHTPIELPIISRIDIFFLFYRTGFFDYYAKIHISWLWLPRNFKAWNHFNMCVGIISNKWFFFMWLFLILIPISEVTPELNDLEIDFLRMIKLFRCHCPWFYIHDGNVEVFFELRVAKHTQKNPTWNIPVILVFVFYRGRIYLKLLFQHVYQLNF